MVPSGISVPPKSIRYETAEHNLRYQGASTARLAQAQIGAPAEASGPNGYA
jgi:hypothetical protein